MTRNLIILTSLFSFCIFLLACKKTKEAPCLSYIQAPVTNVTGPVTGAVNQPITLSVYFGCFNGCGQFNNFEKTSSGNTTTINVIAKYEGCICTQVAPILQTSYNFQASQAGTYELKFLENDTYLTHTIVVQ